MKKLMIAASAALCVTVGFSDVTSANVVGYEDNAISTGYSMITPAFVNVGNNATKLDIDKMLAVEGATDDMQCDIQVMNAKGQWIGMYYWTLAGEDPDTHETWDAGWCDDLFYPSGVELNPGEAVYFHTSTPGLSIKSAGQVDGISFSLAAGYTMIGNGTAVKIDADKMVINGATDDMQCDIQVMDGEGKWIGMYYWTLAGEDPDTHETWDAGWCDDLFYPSGVELNPGEAVYFHTGLDTLSMTIESPIKK